MSKVRRDILQRSLAIAGGDAIQQRVLAAAMDLFYADGIQAVGVDKLIAEAGVAKATLYARYRSKADLIRAYLSAWGTGWLSWMADTVGDRDHEGGAVRAEEQILAIFDALETLFEDAEYRGCAFANALGEASGQDGDGLRRVSLAHKGDLVAYVERLATLAGLRRPEELARRVVLVIDGAMATAERERSGAAARDGRAIAEALIAGHRGGK